MSAQLIKYQDLLILQTHYLGIVISFLARQKLISQLLLKRKIFYIAHLAFNGFIYCQFEDSVFVDNLNQ